MTDTTVVPAVAAGAVVRAEFLRAKGHVMCRMFSSVDADIHVLVDGHETYERLHRLD